MKEFQFEITIEAESFEDAEQVLIERLMPEEPELPRHLINFTQVA